MRGERERKCKDGGGARNEGKLGPGLDNNNMTSFRFGTP